MSAEQDFHEHLDRCLQCRNNPFDLCAMGNRLLEKAVYEIVIQVPKPTGRGK
jgi:hypothetical protein